MTEPRALRRTPGTIPSAMALLLLAGCAGQPPPSPPQESAAANAAAPTAPDAAVLAAPDAGVPADAGPVLRGPEVRTSEPTRSKPLRDAEPAPAVPAQPREMPAPGPLPVKEKAPRGQVPQPLAPLAAPLPGVPAPAPLANFAGMQVGTGGVPAVAPPDPNGAVGPNHFVQIVNVNIAVYSKAGTLAAGFPKLNNAIWSAWTGNADPAKAACASQNDGDPIVLYDRMADRWLVSQFAVPNPYYQCVAVSQTGDPAGAYYLYVFGPYTVVATAAMNDYPKIGVWPDGYYATYNMFTPAFAGAKVCAWDRAKMLAGLAATEQCFQLSAVYGGLLPSDLDGRRAPPAGSPNIVTAFDIAPDVVQVWKFHVDWATPANSTFTGPATLAVNAITLVSCGANGQCIPQFGTSNKLDALGDRLMFRAAYRNLGGHESLVLNHSVDPGGGKAGVRWYELRNATGQTMGSATPVLQQQGTWAPDANYRWMGSVVQDQVGDMAVGYSHSDPTAGTGSYPSIRYAARSWSAAAGTLDFSETILQVGSGAQTGTLARWGDYSAMAVDPTDDCTFWYTNEYLPVSGTFNWATRIGSFKLPTCPARLVLTSLPTCATAGIATSFTVAAQDNLGAALTWFAGTANLSTSDVAATLPVTAALSGGQASVPVTFATPGTRTVTATDSVDPSLTATGSVTVVSSAAASYGLSLVPATATAGVPFTFTITARDGCGSLAGGYTGPATVTSTDPQAVLPASVTFTAGVATGVQVTLKTAGARSLTVTDNANAAITATGSVTVSPAAAASYTLAGLPATTVAGTALAATVTAKDAYGNVATGYGGPATATSTDPQAVLPASVAFTAGVASGVPVVLKTSGARTVTVTDNANAAITATAAVTVSPAAAASYTLAGLPATAIAGTALAATVAAKDAYGNVATGYGGPANVTSDDPQAVLPAPVAFAAGVASVPVTFKTLGAHTVTATDAANAALTASGWVQVGPGPAASYVVSGFAPPVKAGAAASFTAAAKDAYGNAVTDYAGTAAVTSSDGKAVLPGNLTFSAGNAGGSITFNTRGNQTVTVTDTSNASITGSATVSVEGGASSGCGCGSAPGGELAGLLLLAGLAWRRRARSAEGRRPGRAAGP